MTRERKLVLLDTADPPLLRCDLRVLAHTEARCPVDDLWDPEPGIAGAQLGKMAQLLAQRPGALEAADPVRQILAESKLDTAHALDTTDKS